MEELESRYEQQVEQADKAQNITDIDVEDETTAPSSQLNESESLKRSMTKFYRQCRYLQSFCILNYTGFVKILKKQTKLRGALTDWESLDINDEKKSDERSDSQIGGAGEVSDSKEGTQMTEITETRIQLDRQRFAMSAKPDGQLATLVAKTEALFATKFCSGDTVTAQADLLSKHMASGFEWQPFHLGYRFGACLILTFWLLWDSIVDTIYRPPPNRQWIYSIFPIYRAFFCLVLIIWLAACCMFVWTKYRINYIYIFELDPRNVPTLEQVFSAATTGTILVMTNFLIYYKILRGDFPDWIPASYVPMLLLVTGIAWGLVNLRTSVGIGKTCYQVVSLLWLSGDVNFLTAFVADVFTSMAKVWVDIAYTFCVLFTGSWIHDSGQLTQHKCANNPFFVSVIKVIVTALPLYFRLIQNIKLYRSFKRPFPFLANAMKYVVSLAVSLFSSLHAASKGDGDDDAYVAFYILFTCAATIYSYVWDVTMDWGLAKRDHGGLREKLMFGNRWIYFTVIVIDLFGRFMWIITLMPKNDNPIPLFPELLAPFLAATELCRRAMWGCFRLENEHLNNTGFRRFEGPVPDHFDTAMHRKVEPEKKTLVQVARELSIVVGLGGALIAISIYFGLRR